MENHKYGEDENLKVTIEFVSFFFAEPIDCQMFEKSTERKKNEEIII